MADFRFKSLQQIVSSMVSKMSAETPISDFNDGSVVLTLLESASVEDFQQYVQMLNIIRNYSLDTTEGEDLDDRANEYGLTRLQPTSHSGFVTITDTRFTKISTKIYAGLAGPTSGDFTINVDDASTFPASGSIYLGRGTINSEGPIAYSAAPVDNTSFWTITLDTALLNDHGTDEEIILSQFGNRVINSGVEVEIPENDINDKVIFEINQTVEILDGETSIESVLVTALDPGGFSVPANSIIAFANSPFTGAAVTNPLPFVNGRDEETDQALRDRIRDTIQSLSRGTKTSIANAIVGLIDEETNQSVVSASIIPPVILADGPTQVYIDNGRGLEPTLSPTGLETILTSATGGEQFFQLVNFPVTKANLISQQVETFALFGNETLIFKVGTDEETFTFISDDFTTDGAAQATEIAEAINNRATLVEARTLTDAAGRKVIISARTNTNETLQIDPASTANSIMNFSTSAVDTLKLYKNDKLLTKDGLTASILSASQPFDLSATVTTTVAADITVTSASRVVTKISAAVDPFTQLVHPGDYIKFDGDSDLFYTKVRTVVDDFKFILDDDYPASGGGSPGNIVVWNSPQLEVAANGDVDETEVVSFSPNDFTNPAQALASEAIVRIQSELNLSKSELAVASSKIKILSEVENSAESKIQITGGAASIFMGFSGAVALSGVSSFGLGASRTRVEGVGTLYTTELQEGQWIKADLDGRGSWTKVETIEDDTTLYLTEGYRGLNRTNEISSTIQFSALGEGANRDYVLNRSNGQIEILTPLVAGDSLTAGSINTRAFVDSLAPTFDFDSIVNPSNLIVCVDGGFEVAVTSGDATIPYNNFFATELIGFGPSFFVGFYIEWLSGDNAGETDFISFYNETNGELVTTGDFSNPIDIGDRFVLCQVIEIDKTTAFGDPENATSEEVAAVINSQILGGRAEVLDPSNKVRVRTSNFADEGKIQIKGGSANSILGFSTIEESNQLTNLANVITTNNDRNGNPDFIGYTLGPAQTLVVILDGDSANKTFSINMEVTGTSTTGGSTSTFTDSALAGKYSDDYFNDFRVFWTTATNTANETAVQTVTDFDGTTGTFTVDAVFPAAFPSNITIGDEYSIVPRTAENVAAHLNDLNTTTFSISGTAEVTGISGDFVQLSSQTAGSNGKVFVTGGTSNSLGVAIQEIPAGAPVNDVTVNVKAGLEKGLLTSLTLDADVTTPDLAVPYDTFRSSLLVTSFPGYFTGMEIEFTAGQNVGFSTTIASYDETTGEIVLTDAAVNAINIADTFRISQPAYIVDIVGTAAPFTLSLNDPTDTPIDVSVFTSERNAAIRDRNGLQFESTQIEGTDGYKYFISLIQKTQWTIDGLDRDAANFPGIGAAGTQFEVLTPVLVKLSIDLNVTPEEGVSLSSISGDVRNAASEYINSLGVGDDVILSEIVAAAQSVTGVFDVEVENHQVNITIADNELARIDSGDLTVG